MNAKRFLGGLGMMAALVLLPMLAGILFAGDAPVYSVSGAWTNRVTNVLRTLSIEPVPGRCPECGQPDHHDRRVDYMMAYDQIYLSIKTQFGTNNTLVGTGPTNYWLATNLFFRVLRTQPGWSQAPPPLPVSTNQP